MPGTEGAEMPFFSPDGAWLGFHVASELRKVPVAGGVPAKICDAPEANSADWSEDGEIAFDAGLNGLRIVSADGGQPRRLTVPDYEQGERQLGMPRFLPDGRVLFSVNTTKGSRVGVVSPETGDRRLLPQPLQASNARYASTGHLLYAQANRIMAVPFDPDRLEVAGPAVTVVEGAAGARE